MTRILFAFMQHTIAKWLYIPNFKKNFIYSLEFPFPFSFSRPARAHPRRPRGVHRRRLRPEPDLRNQGGDGGEASIHTMVPRGQGEKKM